MIKARWTMMWMTLFLVFLHVLYLAMPSAMAETETIYTYDFESGWGDWNADNGIWEIGAPQAGPKGSHDGTQCAGTVLNGSYQEDADSRLISPSIVLSNVTGDEELSLRFWHWFSYDYNDAGYVQISYNTSNGWSDWETLGNAISSVSGVWSYKSVDLTSYAGKKIRIAFYHTAAWWGVSSGWYIDDIQITGIIPHPTPSPTPAFSPTPAITPTPTPDTRGDIAGQVTDAATGKGISGATVKLNTGQSTTTDTSGSYKFQGIAAGGYTVTASASGYTSASKSATVTAGKTTEVNFALTAVIIPTPTPTPTPPPQTNLQVTAGWNHTIALVDNGTVWTWGMNTFGQLGDGTRVDRNTPVQVSGLSDVTAVAGGGLHSLALKEDGTVWAWGMNTYGQLGDGTTDSSATPVKVSGLSNVIAIACGGFHSMALKKDGTVWTWGRNDYGQLGNLSNKNRSAPVQMAFLSDVIAIAGGGFHSMALKQDGTVWSCGMNAYGQLGDGTKTDRIFVVQASGLSNVKAICTGGGHSLALKSDGTVWTWGMNNYGQLGDGATKDRSVPAQAKNLMGITDIDGGGYHGMALKSDGTVWTWGKNTHGQLGDGTTARRTTPVKASGLNSVITISGGGQHSLATRNDDTLWAWGLNKYGQMGDGTNINSTIPREVIDLSGITVVEREGVTGIGLAAPLTSVSHEGGSVFGFVRDEEGNDVPDVSVTVYGIGGVDNTRTGGFGYYAFVNLAAGDYMILYEKDGYRTQTRAAVIEEDKEADVGTTALKRAAKVSGHVMDRSGNPVERVRVKVKGVMTKALKSDFTDEKGFFEIKDLDADTYVITAIKRGYSKIGYDVELMEGENEEMEVILRE